MNTMTERLFRSCKVPIRGELSWNERWKGHDKGLIACWEVGRRLSETKPKLAGSARNGELPALGWKGGIERKIKAKAKYGTLFYLAQWQGLRGDDLDIEPSAESELVCSKTGMRVIFTHDANKYGNTID